MMGLALVAIGGAIGAVLRYLLVEGAARLFGIAFPWGTLGVNVVGSAAMGLAAVWLAQRTGQSEPFRLFVAVGILGGFTTFSAFSLDSIRLFETGAIGPFAVYIVASLTLSLAALVGGLALGRYVFGISP